MFWQKVTWRLGSGWELLCIAEIEKEIKARLRCKGNVGYIADIAVVGET